MNNVHQKSSFRISKPVTMYLYSCCHNMKHLIFAALSVHSTTMVVRKRHTAYSSIQML